VEQAKAPTETGGLPAVLPMPQQREAARLVRLMHRLAWAVAALVTLLIPTSYFVVGYGYEARHLLTEASLQGTSLSQAGVGALETWRNDPETLAALLPLSADAHKDVAYRIIDEHGQVIAVIGFAQQDPILTAALLTRRRRCRAAGSAAQPAPCCLAPPSLPPSALRWQRCC
jgi:hypothetical protein